jgi:rhodanese-related sulfurtransferase
LSSGDIFAIKGKLSYPMASELAAAGLRAIGTGKNISLIKGGMGAGKSIFQKWPWL